MLVLSEGGKPMSTKGMALCVAVWVAAWTGPVTRAAEPIVYYSFDDLGAVIVDESGHGFDGTPHGGVDFEEAGYLGGCFAFNGTDGYVELQRPVQDDFSLTAWIKTDTTGRPGMQAYEGSGLFWSDVAGVANDFVVAVLGTKLSFFNGNPDLSVNSKADVVTGEWTHVAAVRDTTAAQISIYIDGKLDNTVAHSNSGPLDAQAVLAIGGNTLDVRYYTGLLDEVKIYDVPLTAAEVGVLAPPKLKAHRPIPADGTIGVAAPLLQWTKGDTAIFHDIYLGTSPDLTAADLQAAHQPVAMFYYVAGLTPGQTYYWRVDEIDKDGVTVHTGDVWSFVAQDVVAYYPTPADGANTASPSPTLTWMPGSGAAKHQVYFSSDPNAVSQAAADADQGTLDVDNETFVPGDLESLTTYYWRVDEIGVGGTVKAGPVWSFTTVLVVDDFESYTDDEGSRIYETWIDGWTNGTGSTVGYLDPPFAERRIVHGGLQSMPLDYNNIPAPFYSEAQRVFDEAQDWTTAGADTLVLYIRGTAQNPPSPLYVRLEDASKHAATVTHPDPAVLTSRKWVEWKIPLGDFAGVKLSAVKEMDIGVGDRENPAAGGSGHILVDDIYVTRPQ
jgi:hypothetical protein